MIEKSHTTEYGSDRLSIREWAVADRPREKYIANGSGALSDAELIAILLRSGTQETSALDLSKKILAECGNSLNRLSEKNLDELTRINGIGQAKAITLLAAFELGRRRRVEEVVRQKKITSSDDIVELMQSKIADIKHEEFWALYVNNASVILREKKIGQGALASTIVDVQAAIKTALDVHASGIFLCHNHPSGTLKPSDEDLKLTSQIAKAARLFNIRIADHVIVCGNNGFSFLAEGLL